ncbi:MAG TPA: hypothetical protein VMI56_18820 [Reyranella sp.]|nr:hypothetical protein [Reyranella sp.]
MIPRRRALLWLALLVTPLAARAEGGWLADARTGCKLWLVTHGIANAVRWDGACAGGFAEGRGVFEFQLDGKLVSKGEGEFRRGKREGRALVVYADGRRQEGEYRNGMPNGRMIETWPDGDRFIGLMKDGLRDGRGLFTSPDGTRYDGDYKAGKKDGRGIYVWPNGDRYEGEWKNDRPDGMGSMESGGATHVGRWYDGCFKSDRVTAKVDRTNEECGFEQD